MGLDLPTIWGGIIATAVLLYVLLDGFDLGIGVLTLFQPDPVRRRQMLKVVGNVWDGNESWLIMLAMGLWAVMPDAFATARCTAAPDAGAAQSDSGDGQPLALSPTAYPSPLSWASRFWAPRVGLSSTGMSRARAAFAQFEAFPQCSPCQ